MTGGNLHNRLSSTGIDWATVLIYLALVAMGWISIYAAVYNEEHSSILDLSQNYGKQLIWIGVSAFVAVSILLIDDKYWHILAQPFYWLSILILLGVFFLGKEVNGARAWYEFGGVRVQPTEFVKITTSLVLARVMSAYSFSIRQPRSLMTVFFFIGLPMAIILLQNDTGSALVYTAFLFMLCREGFNGWFYVAGILLVALFLLSFRVDPLPLLALLFGLALLTEGAMNGRWRSKLILLAGVLLLASALYFGLNLFGIDISIYVSLLAAVGAGVVAALIYAYRYRLKNVVLVVLLFVGAIGFTQVVDYGFNHVLQIHQQKRILDLLGIESDPQYWGYNVNQSKIAIGSGGMFGKGFLQGTQTKYDFVPEQSTDFIFCTVGEEWGFVGSALVVLLFLALILRLIVLGERQQETFGRVYCYCAAGLFFFHVLINIGMTIGLMPVIGIPLPFFSYGGSSMIAFTILLFIALRLDSSKKTNITRI
jgi:rod shape determining protein RodA